METKRYIPGPYFVGSRGPAVRWIKDRLRAHGWPAEADDNYTAYTKRQVTQFQISNNLVKKDGIVGPETWPALARKGRREGSDPAPSPSPSPAPAPAPSPAPSSSSDSDSGSLFSNPLLWLAGGFIAWKSGLFGKRGRK